MWETISMYVSIFVMAATPWLELLIVIPIGIGLKLNPIMVAIVTYIGNALPVFIIVYLSESIKRWYQQRKARKAENKEDGEETRPKKKGKRNERGKRIFASYGLIGLAFLGPLITGIHLATVVAMSFNAPKNKILLWMNVSLVAWTIVVTIASYYGLDFILSFFN
ncbi:small multi-drug export protein [Bacillus alkalicellulosilyticus]|uniref:small multi-drug export protein n=1 Tax=Alkalihalobacterium alkalicellulosilyticum TaxID=1912214 RepID=UPI001FE6676E|nr:small multi-drug export protein [Bacillus alkalicellulosilyticus]